MSRKIVRKKETIEVDRIVDGNFVCDHCGKEIALPKKDGTYYTVFSGHNNWGNDSCDSMSDEDACCDECLMGLVKEWLDEWQGYDTAFIDIKRANFKDIK